jgi:hypothetical protein
MSVGIDRFATSTMSKAGVPKPIAERTSGGMMSVTGILRQLSRFISDWESE